MQIISEDILNKTFSITRKGYDVEEVKKFLEYISESINENNNLVEELEQKLSEAYSEVDEYRKIEKKMRDTLISLNEPTRDSIIKAKEQISIMLKEAKLKSEEIILLAENEAKSTRDTLLFLKEQKEIMTTRLKVIIESQEGLLNDFIEGTDSKKIRKSMLESAASDTSPEIKIEKILEKLI